jgi:hypothetical protein
MIHRYLQSAIEHSKSRKSRSHHRHSWKFRSCWKNSVLILASLYLHYNCFLTDLNFTDREYVIIVKELRIITGLMHSYRMISSSIHQYLIRLDFICSRHCKHSKCRSAIAVLNICLINTGEHIHRINTTLLLGFRLKKPHMILLHCFVMSR